MAEIPGSNPGGPTTYFPSFHLRYSSLSCDKNPSVLVRAGVSTVEDDEFRVSLFVFVLDSLSNALIINAIPATINIIGIDIKTHKSVSYTHLTLPTNREV